MAEEVIVEFGASRDTPASHARSTLITTSIQAIRARGRFDVYEKNLPPELREAILTVVPGIWLEIEIALAHYAACDALGLSPQEQFAIGAEVGGRVQGTMLGMIARTAKDMAATPWTALAQCDRLYERLFQGGSIKVTKLGPKDARMEILNNRLFAFAYFRNGFRGLVCAGAEMLGRAKAYAHELPRLGSETALALRISWS
jgi:hypothetical protein